MTVDATLIRKYNLSLDEKGSIVVNNTDDLYSAANYIKDFGRNFFQEAITTVFNEKYRDDINRAAENALPKMPKFARNSMIEGMFATFLEEAVVNTMNDIGEVNPDLDPFFAALTLQVNANIHLSVAGSPISIAAKAVRIWWKMDKEIEKIAEEMK